MELDRFFSFILISQIFSTSESVIIIHSFLFDVAILVSGISINNSISRVFFLPQSINISTFSIGVTVHDD